MIKNNVESYVVYISNDGCTFGFRMNTCEWKVDDEITCNGVPCYVYEVVKRNETTCKYLNAFFEYMKTAKCRRMSESRKMELLDELLDGLANN